MEDLLSGKPMDNGSFQELFFLQNATSFLHSPSASYNVPSEGPSPPHPPPASNNVTTEDPNLSVNTNWLSFFQKAKEKLLAEQDTQQNKSGLYDNHRERTHKKWWKKNSAGRAPSSSSSSSSAASSTKNSVLALPADLEGEEMEASLAAQFDEEISRTSARFYPALPLRTDPLAENCDVEESRVTKISICGEQKINQANPKKNSKNLKHKKKSSANKGGGAFRSTELSKRYEAIQWGDVFDGSLTADCLFVRSALVRKDLLHLFDPDGLIVPRTHVVHSRQDVIDVTGEDHIWVSKPPDSSNAIGIMIFDGKNVEQVSMCLFPSIQSKSNKSNSNSSDFDSNSKNGECSVLQRYVQPLLLDSVQRRKFHLRQMMILQGGSLNSLDIWVWGDVRVLVSNLPWSSSDWDNVERHITNGSVNRQYDRYHESEQNKSMEDVWCGNIQQMRNLQKQMEHDLIKLMKNIHFSAKKSQCVVFNLVLLHFISLACSVLNLFRLTLSCCLLSLFFLLSLLLSLPLLSLLSLFFLSPSPQVHVTSGNL